MSDAEDYQNPLADLDGRMEVEVSCPISPDMLAGCEGWSEPVELDEPARFDESTGRIYLPGFKWECPECGNPHEFDVEGIRVTNLV